MDKHQPPLMDTAAVRRLLGAAVQQAGTQASWCALHDISPAYLSDVLAGRREPGEKILAAMGLERVLSYRVAGAPDHTCTAAPVATKSKSTKEHP
jgi:hypothetical protein